jgi:RHS repeat-associated protein
MKRVLTFAIALFAAACFQTTVFAQPPEAVDDFFTVHTAGVLNTGANDSGSATPETVDQPSHGTVSTFSSPTRHFYTPNYGYIGPDSFTYRYCYNVQSVQVCTPLATVTIDRVNQAPVTTTSVYGIHGSGFIGPFVTGPGGDYDPDGDDLAVQNIEILVPPTLGSMQSTAVGDVRLYSAAFGQSGIDFFDYRICDNLGACSVGTVSIYVNDDPPVAVSDFFILTGISRHLNVEANDYSPDNDPFDISANHVTGSTQHGDLTGRAMLGDEDGFNYVRWWQVEPNFFGTDGFNYRLIENGVGYLSNVARVTILLIPRDDAEDAGASDCKKLAKLKRPGVNPSVHKPVNVTNGNMWLQETDFSLPGIGQNINLERTYNSILQNGGMFGLGWSTQYDESLQFYADDKMLRLNMPDGQAVYFGRATSSDTFYSASPDVFGQVVQNVDNTYTLTFKDGVTHKFDSGGTLLWQKDANGNQTTLTYNSGGFLTTVTDPFGRTVTLAPASNGKVGTLVYNSQTIATYLYYSGTDHLESVTYQDGSKYQFSYGTINNKTYLTTVKDVLDNILEYHEYDTAGRAKTSEVHGGLEKYQFNYDDPGFTVVTDPNNNVSKYYFDKTRGKNVITKTEGFCGCGGSGSETTNYAYDSHLNLVKTTDALSHDTTYKYDGSGNVLEVADVLGAQKFTYNSLGMILAHTDRMNGVTTATYDSSGNLKTWTDPLNRTTTLTYTSIGQLETIKDPLNHVTTLAYDSQGRPEQITDALNQVTGLDFDVRGRLEKVTNALQEETSYSYDTRNRLQSVTYPDSNSVTYGYDPAGRLTSKTDERGKTTNYGYDEAYRLRSITDPLSHTTAFDYDPMSNMTVRTDALGNTTNYEYDEFNRLIKMIYPPAQTNAERLDVEFEYDVVGNMTKKVDTADRAALFHYDSAYRMDYMVDTAGKTTYFEYNARSQRTKVTDANGKAYVFNYDPRGRQLSRTRSGSTMTYTYNAAGSRQTRTDDNGTVTTYAYDVLNRLNGITYSGSSNFATYGYDELSRLVSAENQNGTVTFGYNDRGWVNQTVDVNGQELHYIYDEAGNRKRLKLNGAQFTLYGYDDAGRLEALEDGSTQTYIFNYDDANRLTSKTLPNNVVTTYTYDGMGRLTELTHVSTNFSTTLFDDRYTYNGANQISQITGLTQTRDLSYDDMDRLTGVTVSGSPVESYAYDDIGNRTSSHLNSFLNYSPTTGNLAETDTFDYSFDGNGNLVERDNHPLPPPLTQVSEPTTYTWDEENRLVALHTQNGREETMTYKYDALGRRVGASVVLGSSTAFTYDGPDVVMDDNGSSQVTYQNAPGIDNKLKADNGKTNYFMQDHLGSTIGTTNIMGFLSSSGGYDSFGNGNPPYNRYGFTGREYDGVSGLMYYRARWYDPKVGRFISEDPIGFAGGDINLHGYVGNSPLMRKDPKGLDILVIENGPTGGNPFGHTAIAITGRGLVTYGNGNPDEPGTNILGGGVRGYLDREAPKRSSMVWVMRTPPGRDDAAWNKAGEINYFRPPIALSTIFLDNCALRSNEILDAAGIPNNNWFLPDTYPGTAGMRAADYGGSPIFIPQAPNARFVPLESSGYDLNQFEPR